jgi:hypothetical protein
MNEADYGQALALIQGALGEYPRGALPEPPIVKEIVIDIEGLDSAEDALRQFSSKLAAVGAQHPGYEVVILKEPHICLDDYTDSGDEISALLLFQKRP